MDTVVFLCDKCHQQTHCKIQMDSPFVGKPIMGKCEACKKKDVPLYRCEKKNHKVHPPVTVTLKLPATLYERLKTLAGSGTLAGVIETALNHKEDEEMWNLLEEAWRTLNTYRCAIVEFGSITIHNDTPRYRDIQIWHREVVGLRLKRGRP